jgi:peptidoglycan DL-endopeptidase CwlO
MTRSFLRDPRRLLAAVLLALLALVMTSKCGSGSVNANEALANSMLARSGMDGPGQQACLDELWTEESGFSATALNASSGAFGIPQALPASKMASAGADWQTNPATQIKWGLGYIKGRYGSPCSAWAFERSHTPNWY